ncbi:MAG: hypothetical protein ACE149_18290 [Armatimonadota bacterium]
MGEQCERTARAIAVYLAERQRPDGSFPGPDYYGVASALWLWSHLGDEFAGQISRALSRLKNDPPSSHGEFNIYVLLHCRQRVDEAEVDAIIRRLRFGRRHSANWMLLRAACRALAGPRLSSLRAQFEGRAALALHSRHGFIEDRRGVRSFAYHAFCGALLAELWKAQGFRWAGRAAARAAAFLAPLILPNGDALYVGRGQQQLFGYGALIRLLRSAGALTGESRYVELAERVFTWVARFQRPDGSFPLVIREGEEAEPWQPDAARPGWYTYNRYADYLPFFGCMLLEAADDSLYLGPTKPASSDRFRVVRMKRYTAVIGPPGGPPTNDLSFPYVCVDGESLFPCYGREGERVAPWESPLPYGIAAEGVRFAFRDHVRYRLTEAGLVGVSRLVRHERRFIFEEDGFECADEITFLRRCSWSSFVPANFLFRNLRPVGDGYETSHGGARARIHMEPAGTIHPAAAVTASGRLVALRHEMGGFEAAPGQRLTVRLVVEFI